MSIEDLTEFEKRAVQMEYVVPLVRDLQRILGEDVVNAALAQRIDEGVEQARETAFDASGIDLGEGGVAAMKRYGEGILKVLRDVAEERTDRDGRDGGAEPDPPQA